MEPVLNTSSKICFSCRKAAMYTVRGLCEECVDKFSKHVVFIEKIGSYVYFTYMKNLYRTNYDLAPDDKGIPLGARYVVPPNMVHQALDAARKCIKEFEERQDLIKRWAKYCDINYYVAQNDIDTIALKMTDSLAKEYIELKLAGNKVSLRDFAKEKNISLRSV